MNMKERIESVAKDTGIPLERIVISSGAALYLLGLREKFGDVDASISREDWESICHRYAVDTSKRVPIIRFEEVDVDIHLDEETASSSTVVLQGITILHPSLLLEEKRRCLDLLNRDKDKKDVEKLEEYLNRGV